MPPINYYFSCGPVLFWRYLFLSVMSISCGITFVVTMLPRFGTPEFRRFRGILFILLGLCAGSIVIKLSLFREDDLIMEPAVIEWGTGGLIYIVGAILFITRVPERCKPGTFNLFGSSH